MRTIAPLSLLPSPSKERGERMRTIAALFFLPSPSGRGVGGEGADTNHRAPSLLPSPSKERGRG